MASPVIAIDGPAGSGKSTTARAVAARMDLAHVDSGALYRAITKAVLDAGIALDEARVVELTKSRRIGLRVVGDDLHPVIGGVDVSGSIRSAEVTERVSAVAALPQVRTLATAVLRKAVAHHTRGAVVEGRDIGTVVFPDARLKVFLTASIDERARRRAMQEGHDTLSQLDRISVDLDRRDQADSSRDVAPLVAAPDAIHLDTTDLTFAEQVAAIVEQASPLFSDLG